MRARAVLATLAVLALVPAAAHAAGDQESTFQDDALLVYGSPSEQSLALDMMKGLGVDRVRVSVIWKLVPPDSDSSTKPKFDATDPNAYPTGAWDRYDTVVRLAEAKGIGVNFDLVDPAPLWATSNPPRADAATVSNPDPSEFGKFVQAVGARYSGSFTPPAPAGATPPPAQNQPLPLPPATASAARARARADAHAAQAATGALPRVAYWSLWNEPNQAAGWRRSGRTGSRSRRACTARSSTAPGRRLPPPATSPT